MRTLKLSVTVCCLFVLSCISHGQEVKSLRIGSQVWMVENLNVSTFRNGDLIPEAKTPEEWREAFNESKPAWCYYENNPDNGNEYGKLYNWWAVLDPRGLAPEGWQVPRAKDWTTLVYGVASIYGDRSSNVCGRYLKEEGTKHWIKSNKRTTNSSGFTALPGGHRNGRGKFIGLREYACFWGTKKPSNEAAEVFLNSKGDGISMFSDFVGARKGYSVRCIKGEEW